MNNTQYVNYLRNNIKPFAKTVSGGKELNCRCFYCSDSDDSRKGHFYIKVNLEDGEPSTYYCQKCTARGIVTSQKLLEWNIYEPGIALDITNHNKNISKSSRNSKYFDSQVYFIRNNFISDDKLSYYKLDYLNKRLGTHLDFNDCINNKIILNLNDLLKSNNITDYTRHPNIIEQLDSNFIGFLSYDNAFINMRNLNIKEVYHTIDKRYVNYNIFNKYDNTNRFYVIPTTIDILKPVQIHIAEGPFDILSIYYNLRYNTPNSIFAAIGGSGYLGLIKFFICSLKIINPEIHIYADNDISRYKIINISKALNMFKLNIFLHRNNYDKEKDFGVDINHINESIEYINPYRN